MRFKCTKKQLLKTIGVLEYATNGQNLYDVSSFIAIDLKNNALTLSATNNSVWAKTAIMVEEAQGEGVALVPAKKISAILKEMPDGFICINADEKGNTLTLKSETKRIKNIILCIAPDNHIDYPKGIVNIEYTDIIAKEFRNMIIKVRDAVSREAFKPVLQAICFKKTKHDFVSVATDGRRLNVVERHFENIGENDYSIIVNAKVLDLALMAMEDENEIIKIAISEDMLHLNINNYNFISTLVEGTYPNFKQVVPVRFDYSFNVNKNDMLDAIRRVSAMVKESMYKKLTLTISQDFLKLKTVHAEHGEAEEEIDVKYAGDEKKIAYNAYYLLDALKQIESEIVTFRVNERLAPTMIKEPGRTDYYIVLMPINLTDDE